MSRGSARTNLAPEIRERLIHAVERAAADAEFQAQAVRFFAPLRYLTPERYETNSPLTRPSSKHPPLRPNEHATASLPIPPRARG
jgi:hypothetical protein